MQSIKIVLSVILSGLFTFFTLNSCHKSQNGISIGDYPSKIGDQWIYFVQDSLNHINDTLTVTIVSSGYLNGSASLVWQYANSNGTIDTLQTVVSGDTISYYTNSSLPSLSFNILFPLMNGSNWTYSNYATYTSSYPGNYSSFGHDYSNVYALSHIEQYPDYYLGDNIYISKKIGIVCRKIYEVNFGPITTKQTWNLINYHLN